MPAENKIEDFVEAMTDPKVVQALVAATLPCIKACLKDEMDRLNLLDANLLIIDANHSAQVKLITEIRFAQKTRWLPIFF